MGRCSLAFAVLISLVALLGADGIQHGEVKGKLHVVRPSADLLDSKIKAEVSCGPEVHQCKSLCSSDASKAEGTCLSNHLSTGTQFSCYISDSGSSTNPCSNNHKKIRVETSCANAYVNGAATPYSS
mmetsp:Transcript_5332/g.12986  ORF Transcript_5332/g.12986 Transcript_5332/m.12986 type:complete len:127 (-) Transcript_5332:402-782(-)